MSVMAWPWVPDFPGSRGSFKEQAGSVTEERRAQAGREAALRFRGMTDAELRALDGSRQPAEQATALLVEAALRGLLDETVQAKLLGLLREEDNERVKREADQRFRGLHGGLSESEVMAMIERRRR
jgi:hypothetical protein